MIVRTGYYPRKHQEYIHASIKRFNVIVCHRRFGKTHLAINEIIDKAARNMKRNPQYAYIAPTYSQAKRIAWEIAKGYTKDFPGIETNEADLKITIPRPDRDDKITIYLLSAENPDSIRGIYLDGCVIDEFADCAPSVWTKAVRPTLSDRLGWVIFIGTPKGQNHFYDVYKHARTDPEWFVAVFRASETGIIPGSELDSARRTMSEDEFEQEYECSFSAAISGSYYGKALVKLRDKNKITKVPHDPALLTHLFFDLGISDYLSIWFAQQYGRETRLIRYFQITGAGLHEVVKQIHEFKSEEGYNFGRVVFPHDGAARDLTTGKSRQEVMQDLMRKPVEILPRSAIADGISAARLLLPTCVFDEENCREGLAALENYTKKYDEKNKIYLNQPLHNWASHGADAFRTLAMGMRDDTPLEDKNLPHEAISSFSVF